MKTINSLNKLLCLALCLVTIFGLTSCKKSDDKVITIGTMQQPGEPILQNIKDAYEAKGYKLKWVLYTDFNFPNDALVEGSINANLFQHEPYLNKYNAAKKADLFCAAKLYDCVYGGYTKKNIKSIDEIPNGAKISIASDASNMSRCLFILDSVNLITLKAGTTSATLADIEANPKDLNIVAMSTANIVGTLSDDDTYLGLVNATFAISAGLTSKQLLCTEADPKHINANILACRNADKNQQWLKDLVEVLTSEANQTFIETEFKGTIVPYFVSLLDEQNN